MPTESYIGAIVADYKADDCKYDAISCYEKSFEFQGKTRFTDYLEAMTHIYKSKVNTKAQFQSTKE